MFTRFAYTAECYRSALWIAEQLEERGFEVELQPFVTGSSLAGHPLPLGAVREELKSVLSMNLLTAEEPFTMYNVVATLPRKRPDQVILTAHYDNTSERPASYAPGADDNASGVIGVLEAARITRQRTSRGSAHHEAAHIMGQHEWHFTLRFVLFSGEELGLWGPEACVEQAVMNGEPMIAAVNMDMIACDGNEDRQLDIYCNPANSRAQDMGYMLADIVDTYSLQLVPDIVIDGDTDRSDHYWFWRYGIQAVLLIEDFDDLTPYNHTTDDRLPTLDSMFTKDIVKLTLAWTTIKAGLVPSVEPGVEEGIVNAPPSSVLKLSSDVVRHTVWLEIAAPGAVAPVIFDGSGRVAKKLPRLCDGSRIELDLSDLPSGVYWTGVPESDCSAQRFVLLR